MLAFDLLERPAQPGQVVLGDTNAGIGDLEGHADARQEAAHRDASAFRRELHGIGHEIDDDLFEGTRIDFQFRQVGDIGA